MEAVCSSKGGNYLLVSTAQCPRRLVSCSALL